MNSAPGGWAGRSSLSSSGFAGGVVLTAAAGARRTDSAYPRFLAAYRASDVLVGPARSGLGGYDDALARLPGVAAIAPIVGLPALPLGPGGKLGQATVAAPHGRPVRPHPGGPQAARRAPAATRTGPAR